MAGHRPFQELTGLKCRGKSWPLQRALTDFGAEKSFEQASRQLKEHYEVELHRSSIREVVLKHGERAAGLVDLEDREAVSGYEKQRGYRVGKPWLIVETDGSMVRTGELERDPAGGVSPGGRPKRTRRTQWREARLSLVEEPGGRERRYAAAMGPPQRVGEQMFGLALRCGYGDNTWVHGVGDGAPWIAQQVAAVFPRSRFLLDRYHLLEHLHEAALALTPGGAESAKGWVREQVNRIDEGGVAGVVAECRSRAGPKTEHPLHRLAGYLENRQGQMGLCHSPQGRSSHRKRRSGRWASSGDSTTVEVAWSMVEGGDSDPHAGIKVLAGQSQMGTVLALIPTSFSHTQEKGHCSDSMRRIG